MDAYFDILRKFGDLRVEELRNDADRTRPEPNHKSSRWLSIGTIRRRVTTRPGILG